VSTVAIIAIVLGALLVLLLIGGYVISRRRIDSPAWERHVAEADAALEQARASDRGWDRALLEQAARDALGRERPDFGYDNLHLVLVDDRPGVDRDTAHMMAAGDGGECRVVLGRDASGVWKAESVS
jgi:hypothetical protein